MVKQDLLGNRPVMLAASRTQDCFLIWCITNNGHAWVADGYTEHEIWDATCQSAYVAVQLHMNWGWNEDFDGWYSYTDWSPGDRSYIYDRKMVYNIRP